MSSVYHLKPLSVTTNVVGLQTDDVGHVGQNSSAHVARVVGLQTDAVVVTETRLSLKSFTKPFWKLKKLMHVLSTVNIKKVQIQPK